MNQKRITMIEVIPNEQTPRVDDVTGDINTYILHNKKELNELLDFVETQPYAVGLAANQVSFDGYRLMVRAFALRNLLDLSWSIVIDPQVVMQIGIKEMLLEGCLTWRGQKILSERSRAVTVRYYDEKGELHIKIFKGFEGQIWQHEINHLNGIEEKVVPFDTKEPKRIDMGRNEKCLCGSGKKYKQCCLLLLD